MQKVVTFLERHVQWVALGLAALFLLTMIFNYVVSNPVQAQLGNETVTLGSVDQYVDETQLAGVLNRINSDQVPEFPSRAQTQQFADAMARKDEKYPTITNVSSFGGRSDVAAVPKDLQVRPTREREWVEALPTLPPATL